jgi:hypothetical protein
MNDVSWLTWEWLIANKEWLFSGVGLSVIGIAFSALGFAFILYTRCSSFVAKLYNDKDYL